jgi:hypothetical protein
MTRSVQDTVPHLPIDARHAQRVLRDVEHAPENIKALTEEIDTAVDTLLTDEQRKRLLEIALRSASLQIKGRFA